MKYASLILLCATHAIYADTKEPYNRGYGELPSQTPSAFNAPAIDC